MSWTVHELRRRRAARAKGCIIVAAGVEAGVVVIKVAVVRGDADGGAGLLTRSR